MAEIGSVSASRESEQSGKLCKFEQECQANIYLDPGNGPPRQNASREGREFSLPAPYVIGG